MSEFVVVDVFSRVALGGKPVPVFLDGNGTDGALLQRVAHELNIYGTVFLGPAGDGYDAAVRIFTPGAELPFAGHPLLGAALALADARNLERVALKTAKGVSTVVVDRDRSVGWMDHALPAWEPFAQAEALLDALGVTDSVCPVEQYDNGTSPHVCVALRSVEDVGRLAPDLPTLAALLGPKPGVSCFALGADGVVKTRAFAPGRGVAEDAATATAAGPLAVHLARHGAIAFGTVLDIRQGEEVGRPSVLEAVAEVDADGGLARVAVGGPGVIVARGDYRMEW